MKNPHKGSPEELIKRYTSPEHYRPQKPTIAGFVGITSEVYYAQRTKELGAELAPAERAARFPLFLTLVVCVLGAVFCFLVVRW